MPSAGPEFEESWSVVQLRLDSRPTIPLYPTATPHQGVTLKRLILRKAEHHWKLPPGEPVWLSLCHRWICESPRPDHRAKKSSSGGKSFTLASAVLQFSILMIMMNHPSQS